MVDIAKIDEVSETLGEIKGTLKGMDIRLAHIEKHLATQNGRLRKAEGKISFMDGRTAIIGGGSGGLLILVLKMTGVI